MQIGIHVKIEIINNLFQVDINRRVQGCAAHYEQYCQHVDTNPAINKSVGFIFLTNNECTRLRCMIQKKTFKFLDNII
jgi:hypothetical protein